MSANEPLYVECMRGVFVLPDAIVRSLGAQSTHGFVYLREDNDTLTISATRLADGWRRTLVPRFRIPMFREARRLGIVDLRESLRVFAVE